MVCLALLSALSIFVTSFAENLAQTATTFPSGMLGGGLTLFDEMNEGILVLNKEDFKLVFASRPAD